MWLFSLSIYHGGISFFRLGEDDAARKNVKFHRFFFLNYTEETRTHIQIRSLTHRKMETSEKLLASLKVHLHVAIWVIYSHRNDSYMGKICHHIASAIFFIII